MTKHSIAKEYIRSAVGYMRQASQAMCEEAHDAAIKDAYTWVKRAGDIIGEGTALDMFDKATEGIDHFAGLKAVGYVFREEAE